MLSVKTLTSAIKRCAHFHCILKYAYFLKSAAVNLTPGKIYFRSIIAGSQIGGRIDSTLFLYRGI